VPIVGAARAAARSPRRLSDRGQPAWPARRIAPDRRHHTCRM